MRAFPHRGPEVGIWEVSRDHSTVSSRVTGQFGTNPLWAKSWLNPPRIAPFLRLLLSSPRGLRMKHMFGIVRQLKKEREHVKKQLQRIDEALAALGSVSLNGASRTMSAAGRRKISLAQKARWAKQRTAKPKRTISAAGRRRIVAAQRARWAKVKSEG